MNNEIAHVYFSPFLLESRAERAARCALDGKLTETVSFVGYWRDGLAERETNSDGVEIIRIKQSGFDRLPRLAGRIAEWFFWVPAVIGMLKQRNPKIIQCHSLASLPACVMAKRRTGAKLLYDAHELETERGGWSWPQRFVAKLIERTLIRSVDATVVVSSSIENWYKKAYPGLNVQLVRNIPEYHSTALTIEKDLRREIGISESSILFTYVGALGEGRGIRLLLKAFEKVAADRHIAFVGYGELVREINDAAARLKNVHFHESVRPEQVVPFIRTADIGCCLIENIGLSYMYALPNKLFEYRHAGLAVVAFPWADMAQFVNDYDCGWTVEPSVAAITDLFNGLSRQDVARAKQGLPPQDWAAERQKLASIYSALSGSSGAG